MMGMWVAQGSRVAVLHGLIPCLWESSYFFFLGGVGAARGAGNWLQRSPASRNVRISGAVLSRESFWRLFCAQKDLFTLAT